MAILLGPPEIHQSKSTQDDAPSSTGDPFVDLMVANFNNTLNNRPPLGFTENSSLTFLSTSDPCLDFFFHVVPDTPSHSVTRRLQLAWSHDSLTSLNLICNLRGVRGTGKSDKEGFYACALWLHHNHPKTLAGNVSSFADFGYFKDLLEILYRILEGFDVRMLQKQELQQTDVALAAVLFLILTSGAGED